MWDAVYVVIAVLFFAVMLWYVAGCERLRGTADSRTDVDPATGQRRNGGNRDER
jgi:hypothetical protein